MSYDNRVCRMSCNGWKIIIDSLCLVSCFPVRDASIASLQILCPAFLCPVSCVLFSCICLQQSGEGFPRLVTQHTIILFPVLRAGVLRSLLQQDRSNLKALYRGNSYKTIPSRIQIHSGHFLRKSPTEKNPHWGDHGLQTGIP